MLKGITWRHAYNTHMCALLCRYSMLKHAQKVSNSCIFWFVCYWSIFVCFLCCVFFWHTHTHICLVLFLLLAKIYQKITHVFNVVFLNVSFSRSLILPLVYHVERTCWVFCFAYCVLISKFVKATNTTTNVRSSPKHTHHTYTRRTTYCWWSFYYASEQNVES